MFEYLMIMVNYLQHKIIIYYKRSQLLTELHKIIKLNPN